MSSASTGLDKRKDSELVIHLPTSKTVESDTDEKIPAYENGDLHAVSENKIVEEHKPLIIQSFLQAQ